jgi:hypothetical protein
MSKKYTCQDCRLFPRASYRPDRLSAACIKLMAAVLRRYPEARNFQVVADKTSILTSATTRDEQMHLVLRFTRNYTTA